MNPPKSQKGTWGVDSGNLMVIDPCYVSNGFDYELWCDESSNSRARKNVGVEDWTGGVTFPSGYGDGEYEIWIKVTEGGWVAETRVLMIGKDEEAGW